MDRENAYPNGMTRIILDTLVSLTPEVLDSGEAWSADILDRVQGKVYTQLAPTGPRRQRLIFNMVFNRAFGEARDLILALGPLQVAADQAAMHPLHQATA